MLIEAKKTSLETSDNPGETLRWKMERLQSENLPVEAGLADYIALAIDNIEAKAKYLSEVEKQIRAEKKRLKEQETDIKAAAAEFMEKFGTDRLEGAIVSSVTVTPPKAASVKRKLKLLQPKAAIDEYLVAEGLAEWEEVETPPTPASVRINRRKVIVPEIEEKEIA